MRFWMLARTRGGRNGKTRWFPYSARVRSNRTVIKSGALVLWLILLTLVAGPAEALDPERTLSQYHHRRWTAEDGVPSLIFDLAQGRDGYIWIGSAAGLYRFDGVSFEHIALDAADGNSVRVTTLLAARDGSIWVGFRNGRIAVYRDGILRLDRSAPDPGGHVTRFVQTRDGAIWATFQTPRGSLQRYADGRWAEIGPNWGLPNEPAGGMVAGRDGSLWLLCAHHVYRLLSGTRRFDPMRPHLAGSSISEDKAGRIWRSGPDGSRIIWPAPSEAADAIFPTPPFTGWPFIPRFDRDGNLWGLTGPGIFRVRAPGQVLGLPPAARGARVERSYRARTELTSESVLAFLEDREGNIWLGTALGLDQLSAANVVAEPLLSGNMSYGGGFGLFSASDGTVYVGMADRVHRVPPGGRPERILSVRAPADHICEAADHSVWIFAGEDYFRLAQGRIARFPRPPGIDASDWRRGCALDRAGILWLNTTSAGLYSLRPGGAWTHHPPESSDRWLKYLIEGREGPPIAWVNSGALVELNEKGEAGPPLLRHRSSDVEFLYQGARDLFIGGAFGLGRLREGRLETISIQRFNWLNGSSGMFQTREGRTWMLSAVGIVGVATADLERAFVDPAMTLQALILGPEDGVPNIPSLSQRAIVQGGDGRLWFATNGNVVSINPAQLNRDNLPPPVRIRSLTANGVRYRDPGQLTLAKGTSNLAIQYTALSMKAPQRVRFRYRLEGADKEWVDAGNRRDASYNNLGAGTYRFRVLAANNDGVWNDEGATLEIVIPPTFQQSIWFLLLCLFGAGLLAWLLYRFRVGQVKARVRRLFEERLAERERIARELHDTLLQSFQGVTLLFQAVGDRFPPGNAVRASIEEGLDHADAALAEGRDRVQELRSATDHRDFAQALRDAVGGIITSATPRLAVIVKGTPRPLVDLVRDELLRSTQEAVRNAWRHADAQMIEIVLDYGAWRFALVVRDDGRGIPASILDRGGPVGRYGLLGMRERAERIGGRFAITRPASGGTEIAMSVSARSAYRDLRTGITDWVQPRRIWSALRERFGVGGTATGKP